MITCTEPQRWPAPPGPGATDSEIEAFIEHTEVCRFHADLLRDEEELLHREVTCARSVHPDGSLLLTQDDRDLVEMQRRQFLDWSDGTSSIKRLLVRVPGKTVADLDLRRTAELNFGVRAVPFFQVWKAGRWRRPEVLLATYPLQGFAHSGRPSHVPLANGGFLTFSVHEVTPSQYECHLTCTQPATEAAPALAQGWLRGWKLQQALLGGICLILMLTLAGGLALHYLSENPTSADKEAVEDGKRESGPEVAKQEDPQPSPPSPGSQGPHPEASTQDRAAIRSGVSQDVGRGHDRSRKSPARDTQPTRSAAPRRSGVVGKPAVSYSQVRSIYLDPAPSDFPQQLHDELSKQMAANGLAIEPSRDKADARLRIKTLPHGGWAFRLVNDSGLGIPVSTVRIDVEKQEEVKKAARQVVTALLQVTSRPSVSH